MRNLLGMCEFYLNEAAAFYANLALNNRGQMEYNRENLPTGGLL